MKKSNAPTQRNSTENILRESLELLKDNGPQEDSLDLFSRQMVCEMRKLPNEWARDMAQTEIHAVIMKYKYDCYQQLNNRGAQSFLNHLNQAEEPNSHYDLSLAQARFDSQRIMDY